MIWIHAVSVGEVLTITPLIKKLKEKDSNKEIVLSTITDTGLMVAIDKVGKIANIIYLPFDVPFLIRKAIRSIEPDLFVIIETELWPNLVKHIKKNNIPILLLNGRISEKSFKGYKKIRFFVKQILTNIDLFCMQDELYSSRIKQLGADHNRVITIGNLKFDKEFSLNPLQWINIFKDLKKEYGNFIIVAGSTHEPEEEMILDAYIRLKRDFPNIRLIIAPRHPERFNEVGELLKKKGLEFIKRSEITLDSDPKIILLDVIGELAIVYSICDIAIIGGSFILHGGQNPFEPAYWGKAIVCGPHMENFPMINDFYKYKAAKKTESEQLYYTLKGLLSSHEEIESMGKRASELYKKNMGALNKSIEIIESMIN
jgi:3-deoxy-D-manno-octulosonic-acid transferase